MTVIQHQFDNAADADSPLDIVPVAGKIGAEIRGIALSGDLDDLTIAAIKQALGRHKVIFFRGQTQLGAARVLGEIGGADADDRSPVRECISGERAHFGSPFM